MSIDTLRDTTEQLTQGALAAAYDDLRNATNHTYYDASGKGYTPYDKAFTHPLWGPVQDRGGAIDSVPLHGNNVRVALLSQEQPDANSYVTSLVWYTDTTANHVYLYASEPA